MDTPNHDTGNQYSGNAYTSHLGPRRQGKTEPVGAVDTDAAESSTGSVAGKDSSGAKKLTRRQLLIGVGLTAFAVGVPALLINRPWEVEDSVKKSAPASYELSDEDKKALAEIINPFMKAAANFGVDGSKLTPETIRNIRYLVRTKANGYTTYIRTRTDAYKSVRQYIWEGSPLYYSADEVSRWNKEAYLQDDRLPTFELSSEPRLYFEPSGTYYIDANGTSHRQASVRVDFVSKETIRMQESDGSGSDGAFAVMVKEHPASVTLELIESNNRWYLYKQNGSKQYLLATWAELNAAEYNESQTDGFVKEGRIIPAPIAAPANTPTTNATPKTEDKQ
jgi:hypothetical protein